MGHSGFSISIFGAAGYVFDPNNTSLEYSPSACPLFNSSSRFCAADPAIYAYARDSLADTGTLSLTVAHTFNSGDKFLVGVFMDASVCCGQTVDSSHTLNLAFTDATNLESIPVAGVVPEPASVFLFITGSALIAAGRRRAQAVESAGMPCGARLGR
ncbi:MAG: sorting protein [Massilia sp.]|nr:sorting protein [Massilia sp.]